MAEGNHLFPSRTQSLSPPAPMVLQFSLWESRTLPGFFLWEARVIERIIRWIQKKTNQAGKRGVVFGLSGGIDSAVVAVLCKKAFADNNLALILPIESNPEDISHAMKIVNQYKIKFKSIDLSSNYHELLSKFGQTNNKMANNNLKPRLRMLTLYYFAQIKDYLVVGTGNRSEIYLGYYTKYGDGGVDILPLGNILKKDVVKIAKYLNIPNEIITKPPSAGLWNNQTDENDLGFTYDQLDTFLETGKMSNQMIKKKIINMHQSSSHKRERPPMTDHN